MKITWERVQNIWIGLSVLFLFGFLLFWAFYKPKPAPVPKPSPVKKVGGMCDPNTGNPVSKSIYIYDRDLNCIPGCNPGTHPKDGQCVDDTEPADCDNCSDGNKCVDSSCVDCKAGKKCKNPSDCCGDLTCNSGFCTLIAGSGVTRDSDLSGIQGMEI